MSFNTKDIKSRLREGDILIGALLGFNAPWLLEMMAAVGYDFGVLDIEHEPLNDESVANLIRVADGAGLTPIVRMECSERLLPFLDVGVRGLQVPHLRSAEHARRIVEMTHFYPLGNRAYYTMGRAAHYGIGIDEHDWMRQANEEFLVIAMIEEIETIRCLDEILLVEGIDAFHIGPLDLAQSMGYPPKKELDHVINDVIQQCRSAGKAVAAGVVTPWGLKNVGPYVEKGVQIFNVASGWLLAHTFGQFLEQVRAEVPFSRQKWETSPLISHNPYLADQE